MANALIQREHQRQVNILDQKRGAINAYGSVIERAMANYGDFELANKQAEVQWFAGQDKLIRETLGKEGLDFAKGADLAQRAGRKFGIDPANPLMKNASVFMLLTRIGRVMGEDTLQTGSTEGLGPDARMSAEQAEKQASDIIHNKQHPDHEAYWNSGHARNAQVKERVNTLLFHASKDKPRRAR